MAVITWDEADNRLYEEGVDRAVLYRSIVNGVPWNGFVSFSENTNHSVSPVHFDSRKINDLVIPGDFSGSLEAFTFPDELIAFQGLGEMQPGLYMSQQSISRIGLSYRTFIGNSLEPEIGYKIHLLYNALLNPSETTRVSRGETVDPLSFTWDVSAIPVEVPGFRPSSYFIIDSRTIDSDVLEDLETMLYGSVSTNPRLPTESELADLVI